MKAEHYNDILKELENYFLLEKAAYASKTLREDTWV